MTQALKIPPAGAPAKTRVRPLTGNEAIARGVWEAGCGVAAAYPGTPSTEIMENLGTYPAADMHAQWSVNEKTSLDVAIGASFGGVRAFAAMKHVGLNVAGSRYVIHLLRVERLEQRRKSRGCMAHVRNDRPSRRLRHRVLLGPGLPVRVAYFPLDSQGPGPT